MHVENNCTAMPLIIVSDHVKEC